MAGIIIGVILAAINFGIDAGFYIGLQKIGIEVGDMETAIILITTMCIIAGIYQMKAVPRGGVGDFIMGAVEIILMYLAVGLVLMILEERRGVAIEDHVVLQVILLGCPWIGIAHLNSSAKREALACVR